MSSGSISSFGNSDELLTNGLIDLTTQTASEADEAALASEEDESASVAQSVTGDRIEISDQAYELYEESVASAVESTTKSSSSGSSSSVSSISTSSTSSSRSSNKGISYVDEDGIVQTTGSVDSTSDETEVEEEEETSLWDSSESLGELLGLGTCSTTEQLLRRLENNIDDETEELQEKIDEILAEYGITLGEDERLSFEIDEDGSIIVSGIDSESRLAKIEEALNSDEELGSQLRVLAAKQSALQSLQDGETPSDEVTQILVQSYLSEEGYSIEDFADSSASTALQDALDIDDAIMSAISSLGSTTIVDNDVTLSYQNSTIVNDDVVAQAHENISSLLYDIEIEHSNDSVTSLIDAIDAYNEMVDDPEDQITEFSFSVSEDGSIEVDTEDLDYSDARMIESWLGEEFEEVASNIAKQLMIEHQAEDGDVDIYAHEVVFDVDTVTGISASVQSEEADAAAMEDMVGYTAGFSEALTGYMQANDIELTEPLEFSMSEDGTLKLSDADTGDEDIEQIRNVMKLLNYSLQSEDAESLPDELTSMFSSLQDMAETLQAFHDEELKENFSMQILPQTEDEVSGVVIV